MFQNKQKLKTKYIIRSPGPTLHRRPEQYLRLHRKMSVFRCDKEGNKRRQYL